MKNNNIALYFGVFTLRPDTDDLHGTWSAFHGNGFHAFGLGGISIAKVIAAIVARGGTPCASF